MLTMIGCGQPNYGQLQAQAHLKYLNHAYTNTLHTKLAQGGRWFFINHKIYGVIGGVCLNTFQFEASLNNSFYDEGTHTWHASHLFFHMEEEDMQALDDDQLKAVIKQVFDALQTQMLTLAQAQGQSHIMVMMASDVLTVAINVAGWHVSQKRLIDPTEQDDIYMCALSAQLKAPTQVFRSQSTGQLTGSKSKDVKQMSHQNLDRLERPFVCPHNISQQVH